jgi:peptide/nickel transport system substrate-binding protein
MKGDDLMCRSRKARLFLFVLILSLLVPTSWGGVQGAQDSLARTGAWVDTLQFSVKAEATAISDLNSSGMDIYGQTLSLDKYPDLVSSTQVKYWNSGSLYYEITLNPAVFTDSTVLNPFSNARLRTALNKLIDRSKILQDVFANQGRPKFLPISVFQPDYLLHTSTIHALTAAYAYNFATAKTDIETEMQTLGASLLDGKWQYNNKPVTLIFLIRNDGDGKRIPIGDYVADQLEAVGFTITRQYMTSGAASSLWLNSNPADGLWHLYTGAWSGPGFIRDEGYNFEFFYSPNSSYGFNPLWQAYDPSLAFAALMGKLASNEFASIGERDVAFNQALEWSLNDTGAGSLRIWLIDAASPTAFRKSVKLANHLTAGAMNSEAWPFTIRFAGVEGGTMRVGMADLLTDAWNPIAGSGWLFDTTPQLATQDNALIEDPRNGLYWPQRIERAEVVVQAGLPVRSTLAWVNLSYAPTIAVPPTAWVDWDAVNQVFITAAASHPAGLTAQVKSTVYYPVDLFDTVTWHDGSKLSMADFIMMMIMTFDRGKSRSAVYDPAAETDLLTFQSTFRGFRILSTSPLVVEYYSDGFALDAELNVQTIWPRYARAQAAWHQVAVGNRAEAAGELAWGATKAGDAGIPWTDFVQGASLPLLKKHLDWADANSYIPYAPTLSAYITPTQARARYQNLAAFYSKFGHFWIGTGPFYLSSVNARMKTLAFTRNATFPDPAGKWDFFARPTLFVNYSTGAPGSYFSIRGNGFLPHSIVKVTLNRTLIGSAPCDAMGSCYFAVHTLGLTPGNYLLAASEADAPTLSAVVEPNAMEDTQVWLLLDATAPLRANESPGPVISISTTILPWFRVNLPLVRR